MKKGKGIDRIFLGLVLVLLVVGFFIFSSASLGLLAREGIKYSSVATSQLIGIAIGLVLMTILMRVPYKLIRPYALYIFITTIALTLLVFVPGIGFEFNGARRWILLGNFSLQPAEFLKYGAVLYLAAWLASTRGRLDNLKEGLLPFMGILGVVALVLLIQPDTGTLLVIGVTLTAMYMAAGAKVRDLGILFATGIAGLGLLALLRPYVMQRFLTFLDPSSDPLGGGYQLQQSLIAVGSGGLFGRGFGQSIQKFNFLPEPIGDSVFSVYAEEFGLLGCLILIALFVAFAYRGLRIASRAPDLFGGLLAMGIVILITSQSFINIASMIGVMPLTGLPLLFVSNGGTAMMMTLAGIGVVLNVSKHSK